MDIDHEADLVALFIDVAGFGNLLRRSALAEGVDDGALVRDEEVVDRPFPEESEDVGAAATAASRKRPGDARPASVGLPRGFQGSSETLVELRRVELLTF